MQLAHYITENGGLVISEATHRAEHLIPAYTGALEALAPEEAAKLKADPDYAPIYEILDDMCDPWKSPELPNYDENPRMAEMVSELLNEDLFNKLNEYAPEGFYFSAHEGDGACFGFWQIEEEEE